MSPDYREHGRFFDCEGAALLGVLAIPERPAGIGMVIVVGGPQYRVGSHRQFVLLARGLAREGVASLRFDCRGMGDSEGRRTSFEHIGPDLRAAVGTLCGSVPQLRRVVLWGLCDGATASAFYAPGDARVAGVALFNPWVRTATGEAGAILRHYYGQRLLSVEFWRKLAGGGVNPRAALREFAHTLRRALGNPQGPQHDAASLPARVAAALTRYAGAVLVGLSADDRVAEEFRLAAAHPGALAAALRRSPARVLELPGADHTFSSPRLQDEVTGATLAWLRERFPDEFTEAAVPMLHTNERG